MLPAIASATAGFIFYYLYHKVNIYIKFQFVNGKSLRIY